VTFLSHGTSPAIPGRVTPMRSFRFAAAPAAICSGASPSRRFQKRLTSLERSHCYNEHSGSKGVADATLHLQKQHFDNLAKKEISFEHALD
jgi:hypothetical protein